MKRYITNSNVNSLDLYYHNVAYKSYENTFDVSYSKFYDNHYVVYNTCFNKFHLKHIKTLSTTELMYLYMNHEKQLFLCYL